MSRIVNKLQDQGHLKPVYTLMYTLPGVPSIYYGSEWGIQGRKEDGDPALRPAIDLDEIQKNPPVPGLKEFLVTLGKCRREYPVIGQGRYRELVLTNRQYAFARIGEGEAAVIAVNNDDQEAGMRIPLPLSGKRVVDLFSGEPVEMASGELCVTVPADGCCLFYCTENPD